MLDLLSVVIDIIANRRKTVYRVSHSSEMADPPRELSVAEIHKFMVANDCRVTNHTLVKHFKSLLTHPQTQSEFLALFIYRLPPTAYRLPCITSIVLKHLPSDSTLIAPSAHLEIVTFFNVPLPTTNTPFPRHP